LNARIVVIKSPEMLFIAGKSCTAKTALPLCTHRDVMEDRTLGMQQVGALSW